MSILVTGGAGYIGSHFCALLDESGAEYVALDDLSRGHRSLADSRRLVVGDIGNAELVENVIRAHAVDAVVHFAAFAYVGESTDDPALYYRNNVVNGFALLEAVRATGVKQFVFSSSCTTYGNAARNPIDEAAPQLPTNPYGETKLAFERLLRTYDAAYGIRSAILRYFNASGAHPALALFEAHEPETHLIPLAIRAAFDEAFTLSVFGGDYPTPDGTCVRDYIHICDLATAHVRALDHLRATDTSLTVNLGIGKGYSVRDVIAAVERVCGRAVKYAMTDRRAGDPPILVADAERARDILGWRPEYVELDRIVETAVRGAERAESALRSAPRLQ